MKPIIEITDVASGAIEIREMTDEEYAELNASLWTETTPEETPTE